MFEMLLNLKMLGEVLANSPFGVALQYDQMKDGSGEIFLLKCILAFRNIATSKDGAKALNAFADAVKAEGQRIADMATSKAVGELSESFYSLQRSLTLPSVDVPTVGTENKKQTREEREKEREQAATKRKVAREESHAKNKDFVTQEIANLKDKVTAVDKEVVMAVLKSVGFQSFQNMGFAMRILIDQYSKESAALSEIRNEFIALVKCAGEIDKHIPLCATFPFLPVAIPAIISNVVRMIEILENLYLFNFFPFLRFVICILLKPIYFIFKIYNIIQGAINKFLDKIIKSPICKVVPPLKFILTQFKKPLLPTGHPCKDTDKAIKGLCSINYDLIAGYNYNSEEEKAVYDKLVELDSVMVDAYNDMTISMGGCDYNICKEKAYDIIYGDRYLVQTTPTNDIKYDSSNGYIFTTTLYSYDKPPVTSAVGFYKRKYEDSVTYYLDLNNPKRNELTTSPMSFGFNVYLNSSDPMTSAVTKIVCNDSPVYGDVTTPTEWTGLGRINYYKSLYGDGCANKDKLSLEQWAEEYAQLCMLLCQLKKVLDVYGILGQTNVTISATGPIDGTGINFGGPVKVKNLTDSIPIFSTVSITYDSTITDVSIIEIDEITSDVTKIRINCFDGERIIDG